MSHAHLMCQACLDAKSEIERLQVIVKTAAGNLDSLGAHHYASWCRLSLDRANEQSVGQEVLQK